MCVYCVSVGHLSCDTGRGDSATRYPFVLAVFEMGRARSAETAAAAVASVPRQPHIHQKLGPAVFEFLIPTGIRYNIRSLPIMPVLRVMAVFCFFLTVTGVVYGIFGDQACIYNHRITTLRIVFTMNLIFQQINMARNCVDRCYRDRAVVQLALPVVNVLTLSGKQITRKAQNVL